MFDSPIDDIKNRLSINEVLSDYIQLKKAGANFKAVCPFHNEKTPSFMVSPAKGIWHCFGCGLGGDIFEFIKNIENVEFGEALKILASRAGIILKAPTVEQIKVTEKKEILFEINKKAADYYARVLWESNSGKEALDYLKGRGLTDQTIKNWNLGFAPPDFHYLENYLAKSYQKEDIVSAGLIIKKDQGTGVRGQEYFDRFHDRVMFPIVNLHGQTVGFTGRLLHDNPNTGKYVNSPETAIYNKSQVIFGLYQAKTAIRKENRAILMEGNMDVITAHQAGFIQSVASSGTAFTLEQLNILKRFCENLIFAFDSDSAGQIASRRVLELALSLGFNVKMVELREVKDPDELIKKGIGLWQKALDSAINYVDYFFAQALEKYDVTNVEGKRDIVKELAPLIYRVLEPVTRAHFIRKLSESVNVAENSILDIINRLDIPKEVRIAALTKSKKPRKEILLEQILGLSLYLKRNDHLNDFLASDFTEDLRPVFVLLKETSKIETEDLAKNHPELKQILELLSFSVMVDITEQDLDPGQEIGRVRMELFRLLTKEKMENIGALLTEAEKKKDKEQMTRLTAEYVTLSNALKKYQ